MNLLVDWMDIQVGLCFYDVVIAFTVDHTQFCLLNFIWRVSRGSLRWPGWNERCKLWTANQLGIVIFNIYFNWKFDCELITCRLDLKILNVSLVYKFKLYCLWSYKNTNSGVRCTPKDPVTRQGPIWVNLEGLKCNRVC